MDQELIAYFDRHFHETSRQIESLQEEMTQQVGSLREEMTQQVGSLREEMTQQAGSLREEMIQQIGGFREETTRRFEQVDGRFEEVTESIRHTRVMIEGVRSDLKLLAEGIMGTNESLKVFRTEVAHELQEARSLISLLPYPTLESRVSKLELWRETRERDPVDIIRERLQNKTL